MGAKARRLYHLPSPTPPSEAIEGREGPGKVQAGSSVREPRGWAFGGPPGRRPIGGPSWSRRWPSQRGERRRRLPPVESDRSCFYCGSTVVGSEVTLSSTEP